MRGNNKEQNQIEYSILNFLATTLFPTFSEGSKPPFRVLDKEQTSEARYED
mgnify:CR=1 FL=1